METSTSSSSSKTNPRILQDLPSDALWFRTALRPAILWFTFPRVWKWVSGQAHKLLQRSAPVKRAVGSKRMTERCKQMSEWTCEWPSTCVLILSYSELMCPSPRMTFEFTGAAFQDRLWNQHVGMCDYFTDQRLPYFVFERGREMFIFSKRLSLREVRHYLWTCLYSNSKYEPQLLLSPITLEENSTKQIDV